MQAAPRPGVSPAAAEAGATGMGAFLAPGVLVLMSPLAQLAYIPVSVGLGRALGLSTSQIGFTVGAHSFATASGNLVFGPVLDVLPVRRTLPAALALNLLVSVVLWQQQSYGLLLGGRLATGLSSSAIMLCAMVLVTDAGAGNEQARDRGLSLMQSFQSIGAALGLGLGATFAGLGAPAGVFLVLAVYAGVAILASLRLLPQASATAVSADARAKTLRGVGELVRHPPMLWLMGGSVALGLVIQGSHFAVSALLEGRSVGTLTRVVMSVLIPLGVFCGSALSRRLLRLRTRAELFPRLYTWLPVLALLYALATTAQAGLMLTAVPLWGLGVMLGATLPLGVALGIGWFPQLRATAGSTVALSRQVGATVGPVLVGAVAAAVSLPAAGMVIAGTGAVGAVVAWRAPSTST